MKKCILIILLFQNIFTIGQSKVTVNVKGLAIGDTALVSIQKSSEILRFKYIGGTGSDINLTFDSLANGPWALGIDAKTYIFPLATTLRLNNSNISSTIQLNKIPIDSNFKYNWQDDSSFVGHAQQSYINDKVVIKVLGKAEKVPDEYNGIQLLYTYGFLLSDSITKWTSEESYRFYQNITKLNFAKFGEKDSVFVRAKVFITDQNIGKDIDFINANGVDIITISRAAFAYAAPLIVTLNNVKGKFFSKRLFGAAIYYFTDKGTRSERINEIASNRFGLQFLEPSDQIANLMGETYTNFQSFSSEEKLVILSMFEEYPDAMQRQAGLKYLIRRIDGQFDLKMPSAAAIAFTGINTIEFMEAAFKSQDIQSMQRLVLHEKAHFLWEYTFDGITKSDWASLGGWYLDPASSSGWATTNTTEFVSAYAHKINPNEDMAESIAFYMTNPDALRSRSIRKFEFIRDRIMQGSRYISIIRPDLTFEVYNLFPDYNYPGKIKRTKLEVIGADTLDKKIRLEIELTIQNSKLDGAKFAATRFFSSVGTFTDMRLDATNDSGNVLVGEIPLSKFAKSGYWKVDQIATYDAQNNARFENNSSFGLKCFVNNPLEDVTPPLYIQKSLKLDSIVDKFIDLSGGLAKVACGACADTLQPTAAIKVSFKFEEKNTVNPFGRVFANIDLPTLDSLDKYNIKPYSIFAQTNGEGIMNDFKDSLKTVNFYFPIPDYYPSGYYTVTQLSMQDIALNERVVQLDKDTANKNYFIPPLNVHQRGLRDSVYMKTKYPDYKPPILDLNKISIKATPTNPASPNGETLFEMWVWIKDTSEFAGHAAGFASGYYFLRDPQGLEHLFNIDGNGSSRNNIFSDSSIYGYKRYYAKTLLPVGSPPGIWGVSSIVIMDQARNKKNYSFTEIVRFDVELSKILQVVPYVEVLGKRINVYNQDSATVKFGCKDCATQNYRLNIYSNMGGSNAVFEGKMIADTITLTNIHLKGVNDGTLFATVMMLDSTQALIGIGKASYTKDVLMPRPANVSANLANLGKSNLDSLVVDMKVSELNGSFNVVVVQGTISKPLYFSFHDDHVKPLGINPNNPSVGDTVIISGKVTDSVFKITNLPLSQFQDGLIELQISFVDSVGNPSTPVKSYFYKDTKDPVASITKLSNTDLKSVYSIQSNEYLSNVLTAENLSIKTGTIDSLKKISNRLYHLYITRICNDSVAITLKANALLDTIGNKNVAASTQFIDLVKPPIPIVTFSKPLAFCLGDSTVLSASTSSSYQWYKDGVAINGSTAASIKVIASGNYSDTVVNALGCKAGSAVSNVVVKALPAKPTLSWNGSDLSTTSTATLQWMLNSAAITGATSATYKPLSIGFYKIEATNTDGCKIISDSFNLVVTAINNARSATVSNMAKLVPNPAASFLLVTFNEAPTNTLDIQLLSNNGQAIKSVKTKNKVTSIQVSELPAGNYFIKIIGNKYDQTQGVIISR